MKFNFEKFLNEKQKPYLNLVKKLYSENAVIYPPYEKVFAAFENFDYDALKVVIIGQDPYYLPGMADGLAFSCNIDKTPLSLQNIFKEIKKDYPGFYFETNKLDYWKNQGVLLLNSCLTVEAYKPMSHKQYNWENFLVSILNELNSLYSNIIYVGFGNPAKALLKKINLVNQFPMATSHPSPLGYHQGFENSHVFKIVNDKLISFNKTPIDWSVKDLTIKK